MYMVGSVTPSGRLGRVLSHPSSPGFARPTCVCVDICLVGGEGAGGECWLRRLVVRVWVVKLRALQGKLGGTLAE